MPELPDDVAAALVRGIGTFIRELPQQELPSNLRKYRGFRPQALNAHRKALLAALEDDAIRARIGHWLDKDKSPLPKEDARVLAVAAVRADGWEEELRESSRAKMPRSKAPASDDSKIEGEREKARRARDDLKKARDELRVVQRESVARIAELEGRVAELEGRVASAERAAVEARDHATAAIEQATRAKRRSKSAVDKAQTERDDARKEVKDLRRELTGLRKKIADAEPRTPSAPRKKSQTAEPKERKPLRVPKGRMEDDPKTLERWLTRDDVRLLVDGYNVAKADGGYEDLQLESQRERLVDALFTLAKMTDTETIVVFDAQRVPGRRAKKTRRPVTTEWSHPGEIADDYIVAKLEKLSQDPVIVVTNDKELQERVREHAATIATSQQLLALLR